MRLLVFQHVASEPPAGFSKHIAQAGDTAHIVRFFDGDRPPAPGQFDALLVMGGPMDVWEEDAYPWLRAEKRAIADWLGRDQGPYLGICLGHQLLADVAGGRCAPMVQPEIAVSDVHLTKLAGQDPLLAALPDHFPAVHWHGVEVSQIPPTAQLLAQSTGCPVQAMRVGQRFWGLQFHCEIEPGTLTTWMQDAGNRKAAEDWLGSSPAAEAFVRESEKNADQFLELSGQIYDRFRAIATQRAR